MNITTKLSAYALSLLLAMACTNEDERGGKAPDAAGDENRREVLLTLKNKLAVTQTKTGDPATTKAGTPIATAEENYIRSLDVYVFASDTEGGTYTFQELFYYRDNAAVVAGDWAHEIDLAASAAGDNTSTSLLKLSKGLFVKLYCVANRDALYQTDGGGATTPYTSFRPLVQSAPGQGNNTVTPGIPTEVDFLRLHTPLVDPAAATPTENDILVTPLPMAGANTTPLDLTDFSISARTQASFKLTRLTSRFDIVNDAATSKLTIRSIGMASARRGAGFFPIQVLGASPAVAADLVTIPARPFTGDKANIGLQPGAFYSYPSPTADEAYLVIKGTYAVNQTESKEVSYRVPFKPANDAEGATLEIAHNHRYTIAITAADLYHLDFTLAVADWADDGSIDEYKPGEGGDTAATIDVTADPNGKTTFDAATQTVTMPVAAATVFDITTGAGHTLTKTYTGGPSAQRYDWLDVSAPVVVTKAAATKAADNGQKYTFSLKSGYAEPEYPVAIVEIKNPTSGESQVVRIAPNVATPVSPSGTAYTLAAGANTDVPFIDIEANCVSGTTLSGPDWLTYDKLESDTEATTFRVSLKPDKAGFPTDLPPDQTLTLSNKVNNTLAMDVTVKFTDAARADADLTGYDVKEADDDSYRVTTAGKTVSVVAYSMFKGSVTTAYDNNYGTGNNWLPAPSTPTTTEVVNNRRKYTYQIVIPASAGLDADYQLHKGTIVVKNGSSTIKTYTLWRGASNKPYPTGNATTPYYTALKKGAYWWAPVNCGAKHVAQNGQADTDGIGNLYQWGRKDATNHGGVATVAGPLSAYTDAAADKFYAGFYDWLSLKNDALWQNGLNDPCPEGYRVPTSSELAAWGTTNAGIWGGELLKITCETGYPPMVLPAAGTRSYSDGSSINRGTYGDYWSSTPSITGATDVSFRSATVAAITSNRANGFSVRCLRK